MALKFKEQLSQFYTKRLCFGRHICFNEERARRLSCSNKKSYPACPILLREFIIGFCFLSYICTEKSPLRLDVNIISDVSSTMFFAIFALNIFFCFSSFFPFWKAPNFSRQCVGVSEVSMTSLYV